MTFKAKVRRLGGTPAEHRLRAAENDLKGAQYARDRAAAQVKAMQKQLEECEEALICAHLRLDKLRGRLN